MTKVVAIMSMSLDGYVADANDGVAEVFDWYFSGDVEVPTASTTSGMTFHVSAPSADHLRGLEAEVGAMHAYGFRAGSRSRSSDGAFDAVGDEVDRRAGPWPALGHLVGDGESGHIPRVLAAPAVRRPRMCADR
jgi:hypothetical protein